MASTILKNNVSLNKSIVSTNKIKQSVHFDKMDKEEQSPTMLGVMEKQLDINSASSLDNGSSLRSPKKKDFSPWLLDRMRRALVPYFIGGISLDEF